MKFLKFSTASALSLFLLIGSSCKKDHDVAAISKEQLLGKWDMILQTGGQVQQVKATLKASGAMELDMSPYDGVTDLIFLWDTGNNTFNAHLDADSIQNLYEMHGSIDASAKGIAGQFKLNDPQSPQTAIFTMDKE